jgi:acyl carrier protein
MKKTVVELAICSVVQNILQIEVSLETSRELNPEWDSLVHVEIIFGVEEALEVEFPRESLTGLGSVQEIVDEVCKIYAS